MRRVRPAVLLKRSALIVAAVLFAIAGLYAQASIPPPAPPSFREITDETGRTVRLPQTIQRIVSLAPSLTETVYALGLQDRLVGDTDYCDFPPEARHKPKVGGGLNPSIETIASLHPDVVLVTKSFNRLESVHALENLRIPSYATDPHSVDAIVTSTQRLAEILGVPDSGQALTQDLKHRLDDLRERLASLPPKRVFFLVWTQPLQSIGKDTFIADAIEHAGGISVIDSSQSWPQVNLEELVKLQPEFLVFAESHSQVSAAKDTLGELPGWRTLDAVRNRRFITVSDAINRPAPRIVSVIEDLAHHLHPEAFAEKSTDANGMHTEDLGCAR